MKNEILKATFWILVWLLFTVLVLSRCGAANAQVTVHTQGRQYRRAGVAGFDRTTTITARPRPIPASPLLYINPYYEKAVKREAKEEARKCAAIILDTIPAEVYKRLLSRVNTLSEEDQKALRKRILAAEGMNVTLFERLLDEAEITNALSKESL